MSAVIFVYKLPAVMVWMQKQIDYNTQNDAENELLIAADKQETFH